ncbi:unnamed protein product [Amaranthus hypochondriacus]
MKVDLEASNKEYEAVFVCVLRNMKKCLIHERSKLLPFDFVYNQFSTTSLLFLSALDLQILKGYTPTLVIILIGGNSN